LTIKDKTKNINIELQLDRVLSETKENALLILKQAGLSPVISEDSTDNSYVTFSIETESIKKTWILIKKDFLSIPDFFKSSIIVCEGTKSWDNYLLLHHFDPTEKIDKI